MKITYTAPVRSHHYPYAEAMHKSGNLFKFVSGFTRFSPRAKLPAIGNKLVRHDFFFSFFLASLKLSAPQSISSLFYNLCSKELDYASYKYAKASDAFIFYRTQGFHSTKRLKAEGHKTICIMEEVNCHVDVSHKLMEEEFNKLGVKTKFQKYPDSERRLEMYELADRILCPSEFVRQSFLINGFSESKLMKVSFGFPRYSSPQEKQFNGNTFRILYVGQINYRKGLRYALEAFRMLKHPMKEFIIVGPRTPVTGLENVNVPENVKFLGTLKGDCLLEEYRKASVFILPSIEEGQALVQGEALSMGLPLLITTNTGGGDLINNGREGFIVPPCNSTALFEKLQQMADDKQLLKQMSNLALLAAKNLGSWDDAVLNLIKQIGSLSST